MGSCERSLRNLLELVATGDQLAAEKLFPIVYEQLHGLAKSYMSHERVDHTLQPTALIHEAYLRLIKSAGSDDDEARFANLDHFFATASVVMRRILVNHAKAKKTKKRDPSRRQLPIDTIADVFDQRAVDLIALDDSLEELKLLDPIQYQLVEMRFFGGMTVEQCAKVLNISPRTAFYEWSYARAWLRAKLGPE